MVAHLANPNRLDRDSTWDELATLETGLILSSLCLSGFLSIGPYHWAMPMTKGPKFPSPLPIRPSGMAGLP